MAYTLLEVKDILKRRLKDEAFNEDSLKNYINDAQNEILGSSPYTFRQRLDEYPAENSGFVSLPFGYGGTVELLAENKKGITFGMTYVAPQDYLKSDRQPRYYVWTKIGNELHYNLPDEGNFTLKHLFLLAPKPLKKDTDKLSIPDDFSEAVILGALSRCEQERDNFDYAQIYRNQMDDLIVNLTLRYGPQNLNLDNTAKLPFRSWSDV